MTDPVHRIPVGHEDEFTFLQALVANARQGITVMWDDQYESPRFYVELKWATVGDVAEESVLLPLVTVKLELDQFREFVAMATSMLASAEESYS